jgi:hypothetical protein
MTIKEDVKHIKNMANAIRYNNGGKSYYENYKDLSVDTQAHILEQINEGYYQGEIIEEEEKN